MISDRGKEATYSEGFNEANQRNKQTNNQALLYLPSQKGFPLEENVSHAMGQNPLTTLGNINLNLRLARDQVVHLETEANLCANRPELKCMLKGTPLKSGNASH